MYLFEFILIIVGIALVVASFFIADKSSETTASYIDEEIIQNELQRVSGRVDEIIEAKKEEIIETTDDKLADASNEKIIEFKEYSDQVLEKIDKNHSEVVFLYDMLNSKNGELKDTLRQVNESKKELEGLIEQNNLANQVSEAIIDNANKKKDKEPTKPKKAKTEKTLTEVPVDSKITIEENNSTKAIPNVLNKENMIIPDFLKSSTEEEVVEEPVELDSEDKERLDEFEKDTSNEKILSLYREGKSIVEISKLLGIGQGEVKLIINLYKGAAK